MEVIPSTAESGNVRSEVPNSPAIGKDLQAHTPAITSIGQAVTLVNGLQSENRDRNLRNARIQDKYNAERPYDPNRLVADGLSWKTNFSTKPLATLIDKVVPRFTKALRNMRYLTASKLPERFPNAAEKTEAFRRAVTETCRQHESWEELLSEIAQENSLFGYAAGGLLDNVGWLPKFYRQDCFLVPQGTKHTSKSCQVAALKDSYLLHELFDLVRDREAATSAGWNVDNVVVALNSATPEGKRSAETDPQRIYSDLAREACVLTSFQGSKTVEVWHVLVAEVDGRVTHVAYESVSGKELFWRVKQFESMSDALVFFSFQHASGKLHGSKGIGRELYNMAAVLDRSRNEVVDRLSLSGKLVITCDEKDIKRFRMSVVGNAILVGSGYTVQQNKIDGAAEGFFALDNFLTNLLDQIAGSTSPKVLEGERVTKAATELMASREEERRDAILERFLTQFARMMTTVQRRMCSPEAIDRAALEMQAELLKVMTREELDYLANQPAVNAVQDYTEGERERIVLIAQEGRGNPLYNQHELEKQALTAKLSVEFAEKVLLPVNDPTEQAENDRTQKLEILGIKSGEEIPLSPRDNHIVHLHTIQEYVSPLIPAAATEKVLWPFLDAIFKHAMGHVQAAEAAGLNKDVAELKKWVMALGQALADLEKADAQHAQDQIPAGTPEPQVGPDGQPVQQAPPPVNPLEHVSLNYKDLPPSVQRQAEQAAGFQPATETPEELARIALLSKPQPAPQAPAAPPAPEGPDVVGMLKVVPYTDAPPSIQRQIEAALGFTPATDEEALDYAKKMTKATTVPKAPTPKK